MGRPRMGSSWAKLELEKESMLRINKKFITLAIAGAIAASTLVGCQTAQKTDYTSVDVTEAEFGADYGADRTLASGDVILREVQKVLVGIKTVAKTAEPEMAANREILAFLNRNTDTELTSFRKKYGKITNENMDAIPVDVQARMAKAIAAQKKYSAYAGNFSTVGAKADAALARVGKGAESAGKASNPKLLTSGFSGAAPASAKSATTEVGAELIQAYKELVKADPKFGTAEGKALRNRILRNSIEYKNLTGRTIVVPEGCNSFDYEGAFKYDELLTDMNKEIKEFSRGSDGKIACKNFPEIEAWITAKFQEGLGRMGMSAHLAVQEMVPCKLVKDDVAPASRQLASENKGALGKKPSCK